MQATFWLVVAPLGAVAVLLFRSAAVSQRASLARFARRVQLPVPEELRPRVERLLMTRNVSSELGAIAGVVVAAAWALLTRSPVVDASLWGLVLIGAAFTGAAVGAGLAAVRQAARRPADDEPRLARPSAATLSDYVAPIELHGGRVVALLPGVLVLVGAVIARYSDAVAVGGVLTAGPVAAGLLPVVALMGSEVTGRRLVEQPQSAGSELELAWNDALRTRVLRDLVTVPITVGTFATLSVLMSFSGLAGDGVLPAAASSGIVLVVVAAFGMALASVFSRPHQHFRRKLWPDLRGDATASNGSR